MTEKIELAIFDNDLIVRDVKKYELSEDGTKIRVKVGGEAHWMPEIDKNSGLTFLGRKRWLLYGERQKKTRYFIKRRGTRCVDFSTGKAYGPSIEELKKANKTLLVGKIGKEQQQTPFLTTMLLIINALFSFIIMSALGVF